MSESVSEQNGPFTEENVTELMIALGLLDKNVEYADNEYIRYEVDRETKEFKNVLLTEKGLKLITDTIEKLCSMNSKNK